MINLIRTNSENEDFRNLVIELDKDLRIRDGEDHSFFSQYNKIDSIKNVVVAYINNIAIGCGAFKPYDKNTAEIKRMFVPLQNRSKGIGLEVLKELELWAKEIGFNRCILETGIKMPEAINLYKKSNYKQISNYGQYIGIDSSVCFEKEL